MSTAINLQKQIHYLVNPSSFVSSLLYRVPNKFWIFELNLTLTLHALVSGGFLFLFLFGFCCCCLLVCLVVCLFGLGGVCLLACLVGWLVLIFTEL